MKTLEELKIFFTESLRKDLEALEDVRIKTVLKLRNALVLVFTAAVVIAAFAAGVDGGGVFHAIGLAVVVGGLAYYFITKSYVSDFKEVVIRQLVEFLDPGLRYGPQQKIPIEEFMNSKLFLRHPDVYQGDDRVGGRMGATAIDFSEIHAQYVTRDNKGRAQYHTIFKGLFFKADFNKHFQGETFILPDTAQRLLGNLGNMFQSWNISRPALVKLEDPEFEKLFAVYGTDQIEARYILSPSLMRRIVDFKKKSNRTIWLSFIHSDVYIAVSYFKNLFEPKVFHTLLDFQPIKEYFEDLQLVIGIVEDLNLNTRIWTKA